MQKILVIRSGALGDVIMSTPLLKNLKRFFPDSDITYLVGEWSKSALTNNPNVDHIISFDDNIIFKKKLFPVLKLIKKIRKQNFDVCFVLDKSWMWGLFTFLTGVKKRIGFSRGKEGIFNTSSVKFEGKKHEIEYYLNLLKNPKYYEPEIFTTKKDKEYANKFTKNIKHKIIGIAPGGAENPGQTAHIKRWGKENYLELTNLNYSFIILGGKNDRDVIDYIKQNTKNKNIYDATGNSVQEAKELMEKCDLIITHDSGPLHIASTTNTKIIALFGPTPKERFAPKNAVILNGGKSTYLTSGKFGKGDPMKLIKVEDVIKKIR